MKKISIITIVVLVLLVIVYMLVGNYFYNYALNAKQEKFLQDNPHLVETVSASGDVMAANEEKNANFVSKYKPNTLTIRSFDKLNLKGYEYMNEPSSHKWAIVVHGYNGRASEMTKYVRNFYEQGYNVIAPDLRGHGNSEGDYVGMGWHDRKDVLIWIQQILKKDPNAEIALFGVSMGTTVMMTSGEDLPSNVKVIIEDCGYSTVIDEFTYQLKDLFHLPKFPVMNAANTVTKLRAGYDLEEASAVKQVAKSKTPMLFIHGDADTFVPFEMLDEVYNAAKVEKRN